jgi:Uma2 family endonuclease
MGIAEFLDWECGQPERHEFDRGQAYAMVGGTRGHGRVVANLARHIGNHLDDGPCQVFSETMRLRIADEAVVYPDILVACDPAYSANDLVVTAPVLVIEVLSPSTEAFDRGRKFALYRKLPSLREYALVDLQGRSAEVFRALPDGSWNLVTPLGDGSLALESIGLRLALAQVFQGVDGAAGPTT